MSESAIKPLLDTHPNETEKRVRGCLSWCAWSWEGFSWGTRWSGIWRSETAEKGFEAGRVGQRESGDEMAAGRNSVTGISPREYTAHEPATQINPERQEPEREDFDRSKGRQAINEPGASLQTSSLSTPTETETPLPSTDDTSKDALTYLLNLNPASLPRYPRTYTFSQPELCFANLPGPIQITLLNTAKRYCHPNLTTAISSMELIVSGLEGGSDVEESAMNDCNVIKLLWRNYGWLNEARVPYVWYNRPGDDPEDDERDYRYETYYTDKLGERCTSFTCRRVVDLAVGMADEDLCLWVEMDGQNLISLRKSVWCPSNLKWEIKTILLVELKHVVKDGPMNLTTRSFMVIDSNSHSIDTGRENPRSNYGRDWASMSSGRFQKSVLGTVKFLRMHAHDPSASTHGESDIKHILRFPDYEVRALAQFLQRNTRETLGFGHERVHPVIGRVYLDSRPGSVSGFTMVEC